MSNILHVSIDFAEILNRCESGKTSERDADILENMMSPSQRVVQSALLTRVRYGKTTPYDVKILQRLQLQ